MNFCNKLECVLLASLSIVYCLQIRQEPTQVKHLSGAPLKVRLLALPTNIRLGRKGLPGTNASAYYKNSYVTPVKSFITLATGLVFADKTKSFSL